MEFFYVVKATQKSGKEDAVIWFTAKSEARANLQLDVELEDAGIETGRGKDYAKPVRTDSMHEIRELHIARIGLVQAAIGAIIWDRMLEND